MKNKYIILGNGEEWCQKSTIGFENFDNVIFFNGIPQNRFYKIIKKCYSNKIPLSIKTILQFFIYKLVLNRLCLENKNNFRLIIYDWNVLGGDKKFINKLKKQYDQISLIYLFTNVIRISGASSGNYIDNLDSYYDLVFAFDPSDSMKYGFSYSPLIYDADPTYIREEKESNENLVFYVGQAKDRLPCLLKCFEKLNKIGIKTDFHIANVKEEDIQYPNEIIYNKFMSYEKCLDSIQRATCLIDVIQGDSTGLTIKTCEAVCYDKKLITTNKHVVEYPFYDPRFIRVINSADDIDETFFNENKDVHYSKEGKDYFSANKFLERLEKELNK